MGNPTLTPPRGSHGPAEAPFVFVSVADLRTTKAPNAIVATLGLGSCLGITCFDPAAKVGGMLHVMLPDSTKHGPERDNPAMFLDTGLPALVEAMVNLGGELTRLQFKVFGGAQILASNEYFNIGRQNVDAAKRLCERYRLNVRVWDVGGQINRSIELHVRDGRVLLRMPSKPEVWK